MTGNFFLPEGFINTYCAGDGNIQASNYAYLRYNKISVNKFCDLFAHTFVLVTKNKCCTFCKINFIKTDGIGYKTRSINIFVVFPQGFKTFAGIYKLMNCQPFCRTAAAFTSKFFVWWNFGVQNINIL